MLTRAAAYLDDVAGLVAKQAKEHARDSAMVSMKRRRIEASVGQSFPVSTVGLIIDVRHVSDRLRELRKVHSVAWICQSDTKPSAGHLRGPLW